MNTPVVISIDPRQIVVSWTAINSQSETGGDPVIYYELSWDQGTDNWVTLT
jgi:hypothetical protein